MCGIVGITAAAPFTSRELLERLKRLDYRGYDSWGFWNGRTLTRHVGEVTVIDDGTPVTTAIAHTRWATHGGITERNAHPHRAAAVTIVHNGIIENYAQIKEALQGNGRAFSSETDSEVIAQLIDYERTRGKPIEEILPFLIEQLQGTFAILLMLDGDDRLFALRRDSPLAIGTCKDRMIIASDPGAFSDVATQAFYLENDEYAVIGPNGAEFFKDRHAMRKEPEVIEKAQPAPTKEIHEQPEVTRKLVASLFDGQRKEFIHLIESIGTARKIIFTAAGTAYLAALLGAQFLHDRGLEAQALIASEFEHFITITPGTLVIAISQSGETMDTIEALKYARRHGATVASIVNVAHSTIERMTEFCVHTLAGQEIAVASTKAYTNQVILLLAIAQSFGAKVGLDGIAEKIERTLAQEEKIAAIAQTVAAEEHLYLIGRGLGYPVAREGALKIKEVSYVHAEGMMGGELKHGTIALISSGTPVIALVYDGDPKMASSAKEVEARGARVITIGTREGADVLVPATSEEEFSLLSAVLCQLFAYHLAKARGCPIDKPRNLAKSVTVI